MRRFTFAIAIAVLAVLTVLGGTSANATSGTYESYTLDNGLVVVLREAPYEDIVTVGLAIKAGQDLEVNPDDYGLSYWTGVLMQYGTNRRPSYQAVMAPVREIGGTFSITSRTSMALIRAKVISANFKTAMDTVSDVAMHPLFEPAFTDYAMKYFGDMIQGTQSKGRDLGYEKMLTGVFGDHPYGHDALGTSRAVRTTTWSKIRKFHETYFIPNNSVLFVSGNFDTKVAKDLVKECFGGWKKGPEPSRPLIPKLPRGEAEIVSKSDGDQAHVYMGFAVPGIASEDGAALAVLSAVWGEGMGSRIFQELRSKQGLAYECYSNYQWFTFADPSILYAYLGTAPEKVDQVKQGLLNQVADFRSTPVGDDELNRGKAMVINGMYRAMQENTAQINYMAFFEAVGLGYDGFDNFAESVRAVTAQDVKRVAAKYLTVPVISIVKP